MIFDELPATLGGYEILSHLSRGGMGEVLLGRRSGAYGFERLVALKTIRSDMSGDDSLHAMFLDEARLAARLTHPAVAQVFDFGEENGRLWLAMEYVAGVPLSQLLVRPPRVPPGVAARILAEACRGLHAAHDLKDGEGRSLKVVHRDISPDNLVLGFDGHVKVLDFGIALMRGRNQPVTQVGHVKGKLVYMAPEQLRGDAVDRRSDVYAMGVVLLEMLTGRRAFQQADAAVSLTHQRRRIVLPSAVVGPMPDGLEEAMLQAMDDEADQRWATALEFSEALEDVASRARAPSLDRFAATELAEEADKHRKWLARVSASPRGAANPTPHPSTETRLEPAVHTEAELIAPPRLRWPLVVASMLVVAVASLLVMSAPELEAPKVPIEVMMQRPLVEVPQVVVPPLPTRVAPDSAPRRVSAIRPRPADAGTPPVTASPAPVVRGEGNLTIGAEPFAMVRLDGRELGPTPLIKHVVPAGPHRLELIAPDTQIIRLDRTFQLEPGQHLKLTAP